MLFVKSLVGAFSVMWLLNFNLCSRKCCSMLSSLDCPHSVRMVRHEPAWPPVHGLLRPQGPLQDPPQTPPAPAAAGDCPHKVGGSYHCASSASHTFHLHVLSTFEFFLTTENCCSWVSFFIEDSLLHPNILLGISIIDFKHWTSLEKKISKSSPL